MTCEHEYEYAKKHEKQKMSSTTTSTTTPTTTATSPSLKNLITGLSIYIATGITQPILTDALRINNLLGHKHLLLPTLANTAGMALCGLLVSKSQWTTFRHCILSSSNNTTRTTITSTGTSTGTSTSSSSTSKNNKLKQMIIITSIVDLLSGMCLTFGILLTGGAIFVILYNSCPMWTALISRFVLSKRMTSVQLIGIILVCLGLITNVLGTMIQLEDDTKDTTTATTTDATTGSDSDGTYSYGIVVGSIIVLVGSLLHSLMFVLSDYSLRSSSSSVSSYDDDDDSTTASNTTTSTTTHTTMNRRQQYDNVEDEIIVSPSSNEQSKNGSIIVTGEIWSCCLGSIEASFMVIWVFIGILTTGFYENNNEDIMTTNNNPSFSSINDSTTYYRGGGNNLSHIIGGFLLLVIVDAAHAAAFFALLKNIGAVASALLKGVQAIVVIALSALFFCPAEPSQCITSVKVLSALLVLTGVFLYGVSSSSGNGNNVRGHGKCTNNERTTTMFSNHHHSYGKISIIGNQKIMTANDAIEMKQLI